MTHSHASFIDRLGGAGELARKLNVGANVTGNWRGRGIPWHFRATIARLAAEEGVEPPEGFLEPERRVAS